MKYLLFLLGFHPDFFPRFALCYGGRSLGGGDKNTTNSESKTEVTTSNQQTGASEGSFAVGGSNNAVNIESLDPQLVDAAASLIQNTLKDSLGFAEQNQKSVNDLIKTTNTDFTSNLIKNQGIADTSLTADVTKYVTYGAIALFGVIGLAIYSRMNSKK